MKYRLRELKYIMRICLYWYVIADIDWKITLALFIALILVKLALIIRKMKMNKNAKLVKKGII